MKRLEFALPTTIDYNTIFDQNMISVVILNYMRPWNLKKNVNELLKYQNIGEINIINGSVPNIVAFQHEKIQQFTDNNVYGGAIRFFCPTKFQTVLYLDDDTLPSEEFLDILRNIVIEDPINIVGESGRECSSQGYITTNPRNNNMILTSTLMTTRQVIDKILPQFVLYENKMKEYRGNCEDILFNHLFEEIFSKKPKEINNTTSKTLLFDTKSHAYSQKKNHYTLRNEFCKQIKR